MDGLAAQARMTGVTAPTPTAQGVHHVAPGLPLGRRSPRGRLRWYLLSVPAGRERSTCEKLLRLVPGDLLEDAFVPARERWMKRADGWRIETVNMYPGYAFACSRDAAGLAKTLSHLTVPATLVGTTERSWMPLADEAAQWFSQVMDGSHVIRGSMGEIVDGTLHVWRGPLVNQEARVRKIDRYRRSCIVSVCDTGGGFTERVALEVPTKS
ncbi:transcription termination/antitermination NusG family protein [Olsenella profusa]|uniref:NusG-like N-terminal domain-containing protein n=1 Tax=Olsenella profusa TaxID=138595 RepID=A0ABS2F4N8_9ACTN|nr:transcription termination/antitermination NusG family protein [Olsenella profusa]MBM6775474.1 hypothetical protein [Olsenella profusa]